MAKLSGPAVQWYYKQFTGDQKVLAMDWDALGMHVWLIHMALQEEMPGTIPNDMALIRRWLRNPSDDVWRRVQPQIFSAWSIRDGRWVQKGTEETALRQQEYSASRKEAAAKRWHPGAQDAYASVTHMQKPCSSSSTSSSTTKQKTKPMPQAAFVLPDFIPKKAWDDWIEMRTRIRKKPTLRAMEMAVERLVTLVASGSDAGQVLDQSTYRNWVGLFEVHQPAIGTNFASQRKEIYAYEDKYTRLQRELAVDEAAPGSVSQGPSGGR